MTESRNKGNKKRQRTGFEWLVLVTALAAIIAVVGALVYSGLASDGQPPRFRFKVIEAPGAAADTAAYEVEITNEGDVTAEEVLVSVTAGQQEEEVLLKTVPKGESETFTVVFPSGVRETPVAEVKSYKEF